MTILTNGCFDLFHLGHADFLRRAAALGGGLVAVALNTDASVRRLKGADRPFVPYADRKALLEMLPFVDRVDAFDGEDDLRKLIGDLRPDVLVKGADYADKPITGADVVASYGGTVALLPLMEGKSTSALVAKIRGNLVHPQGERVASWLAKEMVVISGKHKARATAAEALVERLRVRVAELEAEREHQDAKLAECLRNASYEVAAGWRDKFKAAKAEIGILKAKLARCEEAFAAGRIVVGTVGAHGVSAANPAATVDRRLAPPGAVPHSWANGAPCPKCGNTGVTTMCEDAGIGFHRGSNRPHCFRNRVFCAGCGRIHSEQKSVDWDEAVASGEFGPPRP